MVHLSNRKGFALPMAILVIAVLTAGLAAGFAATATEYTNNSAMRGQNRAYHIAEAGLEAFMVRRNESGFCGSVTSEPSGSTACTADPVTADSEFTTVPYPPWGYATVVAVKVRPEIDSNTPALYFIRSTGTDTTPRISTATGVNAQRTVGIYSSWNITTMKVKAAWVSFPGLVKSGTGTISGVDQCGVDSSVAGVMVPDSGGLQVSGGSFTPAGNPPVDTTESYAQLKAKMDSTINWPGILGGSIPADITIPPGTFPSAATFAADTNYWPVIRVKTNNFSLPNQGRGIIIADSNFTISGSNMWSGIVLVGGALTSNGNNTTYGATLSGLNWLTGGNPPAGTVGDATANGQKTYVFDSCSVSKASTKLRKYVSMPNSWVDNLASW